MKIRWLCLALLALTPSLAAAQPADTPDTARQSCPPTASPPPSEPASQADNTTRYYPERAARANKAGDVRMRCLVTDIGSLEDCSVLSEDPAGYGFGQAALEMSRLFKMKPQTKNGKPVGCATVVIPLRFRLPPK